MSREHFISHNPSHFLKADSIVKTFIISECFFCAAWNLITPLFAVFVIDSITQGSIELAASGYSAFLISRVLFELITGNYLAKGSDKKKMILIALGFIICSFSYIGFSYSQNIAQIFIFYILLGAGIGISAPTKNSLFSIHLDKNREATEWSIADATAAICMALATALGGFIAASYGFRVLFVLGAIINLIAIIPYFLAYLGRRNLRSTAI